MKSRVGSIETIALLFALVCFAVAFLLAANIVQGSNAPAWKDAGFLALVVALLAGSRR